MRVHSMKTTTTKIRKLLIVVAVAVLAGVSLFVGLRQSPSEKLSIWIDAARPISIEYPMEIVEIGPNGELGLHLPSDAGRGWNNEGVGEATYQFYAPQDGTYTLWAWCLWHDECTDAVYVQFDDLPKAILGNDPVYDEWHWVKGFAVPLKKGFHRLTLSNHSPNIAILKMFLTNDAFGVPPDADLMLASVLFSDDFNGCDHGNFPMWRKASGSWKVVRPQDVLTGVSDLSEDALIVFDSEDWRKIRKTVAVFCDSPMDGDAWIGLRFSVMDDANYQEFRLSPLADVQEAIVRHVQCQAGTVSTLAEGRIPWRRGNWHELHLDLSGPRPSLLLDGGAKFMGGEGRIIQGGIGLSLHGRLTASFDNVLIQSAEGE